MKITVHVTKEILERSKMCNSGVDCSIPLRDHFNNKSLPGFNCAIGIAIVSLLPNAVVDNKYIFFYRNAEDFARYNHYKRIELPEEASDFIFKFDKLSSDDRIKMEPITFEIEVPDLIINEIGIDQVHAILKESKTLSLVDN